jgi:two-component system response regulator YesN
MPGEFPLDVGPLIIRKSSQIVWSSFEYYSPLKRLLRHVSEHPGEALSLAHAAGIASLEYTHFAAYFRKKTGVTFKCWIDFVRVCWAVQMLESVDKSITEVAQDSGFEDGTTFCRTFRRVTGMTPTQYRRRRLKVTPKG